VPRFENRIISECPVTYARKLPMLLRVIAGDLPISTKTFGRLKITKSQSIKTRSAPTRIRK